jgi:nicotinate-nucleotide adenylyltransferase
MTGTGRTGVLGGTFDPLHLGHLAVARAARVALALDAILLVPSGRPVHKHTQPEATAEQRLAMVTAVAGASEGTLRASDMELRREGASYTADTLRALQAGGQHPWQIFFLTGADAFAEIATWRDYPALLDLAHFAVCARPGYAVAELAARHPPLEGRVFPAAALRARPILGRGTPTRVFVLNVETPDISSTMIRAQARAGQPIADLVPPEVDSYIRHHGLYGAQATQGPGAVSAAGHLHE